MLQKIERFKASKDDLNNPLLRFCTDPKCNSKIYAKTIDDTMLVCGNCGTEMCFKCREPWHPNFTDCEKAFIDRLGEQKESERVMFCPMCKLKVHKYAGCNHITCYVCSFEWCWVCGLNYFSYHCYAGVKRKPSKPEFTNAYERAVRLFRDMWRDEAGRLVLLLSPFYWALMPMALVWGPPLGSMFMFSIWLFDELDISYECENFFWICGDLCNKFFNFKN
mgnify:CR=1 FL=1